MPQQHRRRGRGSNQHADRPPAQPSRPLRAADDGRATWSAATSDPFAAEGQPTGCDSDYTVDSDADRQYQRLHVAGREKMLMDSMTRAEQRAYRRALDRREQLHQQVIEMAQSGNISIGVRDAQRDARDEVMLIEDRARRRLGITPRLVPLAG